ncbi:F-box/WD repeat-containing protein 7-like [Haliotis rufescens]|uniref:F-box/WD repeat-containing protein 7-like n=1 Tax=Haliotis rufescens TaxID=6454 RepID=UPI00201F64F3|nr:F-box/WD repeat-containing protein 7-like [Haliotis rufescens]
MGNQTVKKTLTKTSKMTLSTSDFTEHLPQELCKKVLTYLGPTDLASFSQCCVRWREMANINPLWLHHCMVRHWLKFGLHTDILHEETLYPKASNVSGTSPTFSLQIPEGSKLSPICKWKHIYVCVCHLHTNWARGRYTVSPIFRGHKEKVTAMDCDNHCIVSGSEDKALRVWDIHSTTCIHTINCHSDTVTAVKLKNNMIVTGCADSSIRVLNSSSGKLCFSLQGHSGSVDHIQLSGDKIISAGTDKTVRIWSIKDRKLLCILRGHTDEIECLSNVGSYALTGSWDNTLMLWDVEKGRLLFQLSGHTEVISCCQFDSEKIVSGSADKDLRIWSMSSGKCTHILSGHDGEVYCLAYNKEVIASGCSDSAVIIWNLAGELLHKQRQHLGIVRCIHLNDDRLVTGGDQKKLVVWDYRSGQVLNCIHRHPTLLHLIKVCDLRLVTASPEKPGTITVLSYW